MTPIRAIGGQVICDHGPVSLATARGLARFYLAEAELAPEPWRAICACRALALARAIEGAGNWRRAAGWRSPDAADHR